MNEFRKLNSVRKGLLTNAVTLWRSKSSVKRMETNVQELQQKTRAEKLSVLLDELYKNRLRDSLEALKDQVRELRIKKRAINFIMKSNFGRMHYYFHKWKNVPKKSYLHENNALTILQNVLRKIWNRNMKLGFDPLKDIWYEIAQIKRKYILQMLHRTEGKTKLYFHLWAHNARNIAHIEACKATFSMFETLNFVLKDNFSSIFSPDMNAQKMSEAIR